jgi:peptidoglycan/xylan/chitin deacetylase (PgdA/CDA1 family)
MRASSSIAVSSARRDVRLPALLYHNIGAVPSEPWRGLTVTPSAFDRHIAILRGAGYEGISCARWLDSLAVPHDLPRKPLLITFDDAYASLAAHALPAIIGAGWTATVFVPTALMGRAIRRHNPVSAEALAVMDRREVREWARRGIEFGGHSRTHRNLTALSDSEIHDEVHGSHRDLEDASGHRVRAFAYPYGRSDERVIGAVREVYDAAFTLQPGINNSRTDPLAMRRSMVQHADTAMEVWMRVTAGWNPVEALKTKAMKWRTRETA